MSVCGTPSPKAASTYREPTVGRHITPYRRARGDVICVTRLLLAVGCHRLPCTLARFAAHCSHSALRIIYEPLRTCQQHSTPLRNRLAGPYGFSLPGRRQFHSPGRRRAVKNMHARQRKRQTARAKFPAPPTSDFAFSAGRWKKSAPTLSRVLVTCHSSLWLCLLTTGH